MVGGRASCRVYDWRMEVESVKILLLQALNLLRMAANRCREEEIARRLRTIIAELDAIERA